MFILFPEFYSLPDTYASASILVYIPFKFHILHSDSYLRICFYLIYIHMRTHIHMYTRYSVCMYIHTLLCIHVSVYVYTYAKIGCVCVYLQTLTVHLTGVHCFVRSHRPLGICCYHSFACGCWQGQVWDTGTTWTSEVRRSKPWPLE